MALHALIQGYPHDAANGRYRMSSLPEVLNWLVGAVVIAAVYAFRYWAAQAEREQAVERAKHAATSELRQRLDSRYDLDRSHPELQDYVRFAVRALGSDVVRRYPVEVPPPAIDDRLAYAKHVIRLATERFGLASTNAAVRFADIDGPHAGAIERRGGRWYIDLDRRFESDPERLTAVIVHEVAHMLLGERGFCSHQ